MNEISDSELNGRIMALIAQRNKAMDENVVLAGQVSVLREQIDGLRTQLASSQEELKKALVAGANAPKEPQLTVIDGGPGGIGGPAGSSSSS